ncbi:MAG: hypothetical protein ABSG91_14330, partial [Syntrophobacteraceae bacterium]
MSKAWQNGCSSKGGGASLCRPDPFELSITPCNNPQISSNRLSRKHWHKTAYHFQDVQLVLPLQPQHNEAIDVGG